MARSASALPDGRIVPLTVWSATIKRELGLYDVVYVHVVEPRSRAPKLKDNRAKSKAVAAGAQAQLRVRPTVQGAALVLENKTGRILAMAGSFSYPLSQLNRTAQTQRQPGSAMKPVTYLTALERGLQPNTLIPNEPITFPPIGSGIDGRDAISRDYDGSVREEDFWTPRNDDFSEGGVYTLRRGLENSVNVVTAHLLDGGIDDNPEKSLDDICATAVAAKIYSDCVRYYPFILGAQPVRDDRSCRVLCGNRQRRRSAATARHRFHRTRRPHDLSISGRAAAANRRRRSGGVLSAQEHFAGRRGARHRAGDRCAFALCRGQDRHHRKRRRRLVHRLHQ